MRFFNLILISVALLASAAQADVLSDASYLRKLSLHLRGHKPSVQDYNELERSTNKQAFFEQKIAEYVNSPEAQDRMVYRLSERFAIIPPSLDLNAFKQIPEPLRNYYGSISTSDLQVDALTDLFRRMASENLPWNALLTNKSYNLFPNNSNAENTDLTFFSVLFPNLPVDQYDGNTYGHDKAPQAPVPVQFADDDPRIAGALTTSRFLSRYSTTNLNKNRRRAAAVFRIFLCDPMFPIIPPPADKKTAALNQAFADSVHANVRQHDSNGAMTISEPDRHGSVQSCAACHYKLDPLGVTFQNSGIALGPTPSPGYLTYTRADKTVLKTYLRGVGDLGRELVKQPEFVNCQIDWFWKQFIGNDVALTDDRRSELAKSFEAVGRRTNDFIKVLVSAKEFRQHDSAVTTSSNQVSYAQVSPILKRCDTCHNDSEKYLGDTLAAANLSPEELKEMVWRVNLGDSDRRKMPEDWDKWDAKDLNLLKLWLKQGAVNASGTAQLGVAK